MKQIAFDCETYLIPKRGKATLQATPTMICMTWYDVEAGEPRVDRGRWACERFVGWLEDPGVEFVGINVAFDMRVLANACARHLPDVDVLPLVFAAYDERRVRDLMIAEKLEDIAENGGIFGAYGMAALVKKHLGEKIEEKSGATAWRLRYNELDDLPFASWPEAAQRYALLDAEYTYRLIEHIPRHRNEAFQVTADFWLGLSSSWGLRVDREWAERIDAFYAFEEHEAAEAMRAAGLMTPEGTVKDATKRSIAESAYRSLGMDPPLTASGKVQADKKAFSFLEKQGVKDERFAIYSRYNRATKFRSTYLTPILDAGDDPLCPDFNVLVDSGRASAKSPNVQNFPARTTELEAAVLKYAKDPSQEAGLEINRRWPTNPWRDELADGDLIEPEDLITGPDIRGCFRPRAGKVFVACDYTSAEAAGLAQVLCNLNGGVPTAMGEAINDGLDLNLLVASQILGLDYEEAKRRKEAGDAQVKLYRQAGKAAIYGFPGGASPRTWTEYAAGYGVYFTQQQAEDVRAAWLSAFPEMVGYFAWISRHELPGRGYQIEQHGPGGVIQGWRTRKTPSYTSCCNTLFQGLVADGAKYAGWLISKACYVERESVLYGARCPLFVHDEFVIEVDEEKAEGAAEELSRLMVEGLKAFLPDIKIGAEPEILRERWAK